MRSGIRTYDHVALPFSVSKPVSSSNSRLAASKGLASVGSTTPAHNS